MKKIFYISFEPINERFIKSYFLRDLIDSKCNINYLHFNYSKSKNSNNAKIKNISFFDIHSIKELSSFIKKNNVTTNFIVLLFLPYDNITKNIYRLFCNSRIKLIYFDWGSFPISRSSQDNKILLFLLNQPIFDFFKILYSKLLIRKCFPVDFLFFSGSSPRTLHLLKPINKINIDFFDTVTFKNIKKKNNNLKREYAVFLDVNMTNHPDFDLLNISKINPVDYYKNINEFFEYLEKKYNIEVVIAAHPTLQVSEYKNYNNRIVIKSNTAELVSSSKFVITHHSTSISFALLAFKPIIFVYNNHIAHHLRKNVFKSILGQAYALNQPKINISFRKEFENFSLDYNEKRYRRFLKKYIYTGKSSSHPSKTFLSNLNHY
tara:strand:+ start:1795 stop:2925 length:1131 start_codon:yes stop_codon:yes gene_type:complete